METESGFTPALCNLPLEIVEASSGTQLRESPDGSREEGSITSQQTIRVREMER